jgi:hypothetical protein
MKAPFTPSPKESNKRRNVTSKPYNRNRETHRNRWIFVMSVLIVMTLAGGLYTGSGITGASVIEIQDASGCVAGLWNISNSTTIKINSSCAKIHVQSNATLTFDNNGASNRLIAIIGDTIIIEGTVTANGEGQTGGTTEGADGSGNAGGKGGVCVFDSGGGGAGYGGDGGRGASGNGESDGGYGNVSHPVDVGSGGGAGGELNCNSGSGDGGTGGGAIKINATGTITITGTVSANGNAGENHASRSGGGGSGGSVWLNAQTIEGTGTIQATGGDGGTGGEDGGGGAGGRIALHHTSYTFTGGLKANGGDSDSGDTRRAGGAGTIYIWDRTEPGDLIIDNVALTTDDAGTDFNDDFPPFRNVFVQNYSDIEAGSGAIDMDLTGNFTLAAVGRVETNVNITADNIIIESGTVITADGQGQTGATVSCGDGNGPGKGKGGEGTLEGGGGGASHGGLGALGESGGGRDGTYGSSNQPVASGSGGGAGGESGCNANTEDGGEGGGIIILNATNTLNVNGTLSADGTAGDTSSVGGGGGGGSGGSIWFISKTLIGSGSIGANGGDGGGGQAWTGGGGGGGRIGIQCDPQTNITDFLATLTVTGGEEGSGSSKGADGTVSYACFEPTITLNAPDDNNNTVFNYVALNATVEDNDGDTMVVYFMGDGAILDTQNSIANNSGVQYNWTNLGTGAHTWSVIVFDTTANYSSVNRTFTIPDTTIPNITNATPIVDSTFNFQDTIEIGANVTDDSEISVVIANVTYPNSTIQTIVLTQQTGTITYNTSFTIPQQGGLYLVNIIANDTTNNINNTQTNFTVADNAAPNVTGIVPETNRTFNTTDSIVLSANVADDGQIAQVFANFTYPNASTFLYQLLNNHSGNTTIYNLTFSFPRLEGIYNLTIIANDTAGNLNNSETSLFNATHPDTDNDGIPDFNDTLIGDHSFITLSGVTEVNLTINHSIGNKTYNGTQIVTIWDGTTVLVNFTHNFSLSHILDLRLVSLEVSSTSTVINLSGQLSGNETKEVYIPDGNYEFLCAADKEITTAAEISANCLDANETRFSTCSGKIGTISCSDRGALLRMSNLTASGVRGTLTTPDAGGAPGGGGASGGGETGDTGSSTGGQTSGIQRTGSLPATPDSAPTPAMIDDIKENVDINIPDEFVPEYDPDEAYEARPEREIDIEFTNDYELPISNIDVALVTIPPEIKELRDTVRNLQSTLLSVCEGLSHTNKQMFENQLAGIHDGLTQAEKSLIDAHHAAVITKEEFDILTNELDEIRLDIEVFKENVLKLFRGELSAEEKAQIQLFCDALQKRVQAFQEKIELILDAFAVLFTEDYVPIYPGKTVGPGVGGLSLTKQPVNKEYVTAQLLAPIHIDTLAPGETVKQRLKIKLPITARTSIPVDVIYTTYGQEIARETVFFEVLPKVAASTVRVDKDIVDVYAVISDLPNEYIELHKGSGLPILKPLAPRMPQRFIPVIPEDITIEMTIRKNAAFDYNPTLSVQGLFESVYRGPYSGFGEVFGPYPIKEKERILLAQQFAIDPRFADSYEIEFIFRRGGTFIARQRHPLELEAEQCTSNDECDNGICRENVCLPTERFAHGFGFVIVFIRSFGGLILLLMLSAAAIVVGRRYWYKLEISEYTKTVIHHPLQIIRTRRIAQLLDREQDPATDRGIDTLLKETQQSIARYESAAHSYERQLAKIRREIKQRKKKLKKIGK